MIRNDFSFGSYKIRSVLDPVQFVDGYFIEIHHISDDMIGTLLFFKKKTTARNTVSQRNGGHSHRAVVIDQRRLLRLKFMEKDFIGQRFAKESK